MLNGQKIITLCISRLYDNEHHRFVMQLNEKLRKMNAVLWIYHVNTDLYWNEKNLHAEASVFDLIDFSITDAVILMDEKIKSRTVAEKVISRAKQAEIPVIVVDNEYPDCISVCFDYQSGFESVVRHVLNFHHARHPHFMGGFPGNPFSDQRLSIFRKLLEEYHIPFDEETMVSYGMFWAQPAAEAAEKIVASGNLPDAIICANDIMAINVVSVLNSHGISVPEQVIVTGFDGIDEIYFSVPSITSVQCCSSALTETIFSALENILSGKAEISRHYVRPEIIYNDSCGCRNTSKHNLKFNFNDRFYRYQIDTQIIHQLTEKMQSCLTFKQAAECLFCEQIQDMSFIINQWCTDNSVNHFAVQKDSAFEEEMFLFFTSEQENFHQGVFHRRDIMPNLKEFQKTGYPLIFNAVSFLGVPLGYLCFHFPNYELTNYCKIHELVNTLGQSLGVFMNWQYQRYLMEQIEFTYKYDALTGLLNRLCFSREFGAWKQNLNGETVPMAVILSDLDGLKKINDIFGHNAGDNAIHTVAQALKNACPPDALCVRFGGDEMLAVIAGEYSVPEIIQKIHQYLENYNQVSGLDYQVSASIGGYTGFLSANTEFEEIIQKADKAMYSQKQNKKKSHQ